MDLWCTRATHTLRSANCEDFAEFSQKNQKRKSFKRNSKKNSKKKLTANIPRWKFKSPGFPKSPKHKRWKKRHKSPGSPGSKRDEKKPSGSVVFWRGCWPLGLVVAAVFWVLARFTCFAPRWNWFDIFLAGTGVTDVGVQLVPWMKEICRSLNHVVHVVWSKQAGNQR